MNSDTMPDDDSVESVVARVADEPTPQFAAEVAEECQRLLDQLGDEERRSIAVGKREGDTNEQTAERLGCALATVERRLRVLRTVWEGESAS
jgi:DNA-directed RNA polymerase specialized sigma24 family protein